jgi:tRNA (adenine57-N1/adenine58-N1)-methyltransferase
MIDLSELLKKNFGERIKTHTGEEFVIIKPTIIDLLMKKVRRLPQIITPKDASLILAYTGIPTNSLIVDCGTGSGFLSIFLAYYCSEGKVITYEKRSEFAEVARKNIELTGLKNIILKEKDVLKGIDEKNVDMITVDMEKAEKIVKKVFKALKPGGWLVIYSPYVEQVISVRKEIEKLNFTQIKTVENITREWRVGNHTLPEVSGVMHTGWLTFARKVI